MFTNFFLELRQAKVPVSIKEYLALMEAMDKHVADYSVDNFYYLSRSVLVKDERNLLREALNIFYDIREVPGLKKKPSTSELLDWLKLLMVEDMPPEALRSKDSKQLIPPLHGALLKNEQDVHLFERLAFMARREQRQ